jgi:hypothetical protein
MAVAAKVVAAPTGTGVLFEHGDVQAALGQVRRGGDSTQPSADNEDRFLDHVVT